jgi:hypothetical protein
LRNIKPLTEAAPFFGFPCATLIAKYQATDRSGSLFGFPFATLIAKNQATDGSGYLLWFSLCNTDCETSSDGWERLPFLVFLVQH